VTIKEQIEFIEARRKEAATNYFAGVREFEAVLATLRKIESQQTLFNLDAVTKDDKPGQPE